MQGLRSVRNSRCDKYILKITTRDHISNQLLLAIKKFTQVKTLELTWKKEASHKPTVLLRSFDEMPT